MATGRNFWRRAALLLLACALLLRLPAGFMPQANGQGVAFGWCNAVDPSVAAEGEKLLAAALADRPVKQAPQPDEPCPFAPAMHALVAGDPLPELQPAPAIAELRVPEPRPAPGRGLAAPPPLSTGPPLLA